MTQVTITLEDEVARWARIAAAERELSLSRFVGDLLRERMEQHDAYQAAMRDFLAVEPLAGSGGRPYPSRDEIHERSALR